MHICKSNDHGTVTHFPSTTLLYFFETDSEMCVVIGDDTLAFGRGMRLATLQELDDDPRAA